MYQPPKDHTTSIIVLTFFSFDKQMLSPTTSQCREYSSFQTILMVYKETLLGNAFFINSFYSTKVLNIDYLVHHVFGLNLLIRNFNLAELKQRPNEPFETTCKLRTSQTT